MTTHPDKENAPPRSKGNALNVSHIGEESARIQVEIERAEGEARAEELLTKRLAAKEALQ